jgi:hypothetical protein
MYDLPWWVMGVMCLAVIGLMVLLLAVIIIRVNLGRRRDPLEEDFDDRPRRPPRRPKRD